MATQTNTYKLVKPELSDAADITGTNVNWGIVDTELQSLNLEVDNNANKITLLEDDFQKQLTVLTNKLTDQTNTIKTLQPKIKYGNDEPSDGVNGDIYIQLI